MERKKFRRKGGFWSRVNRAVTEVGIEHFDDDCAWDDRVKLPAWQLERLADREAQAPDKTTHGRPLGEAKIDAASVMRAYQIILRRGVGMGSRTTFGTFAVETDYDGYGITLTDGAVRVRVLFHNQVSIDSPNRRALVKFRRELHELLT